MSPQEAIKMFRAEIGLSQIELAEKLCVGFSTLNRWENGKAFPSHSNANNIIRTAKDMGASENCLKYLNEMLLPPRMRGRTASELGFPALDQGLLCQMVDSSTAGVVIIDAETKHLLYVNRRAEELAGARFFETTARHCWSYLKHLDQPCAGCDGDRFPAAGFCERIDVSPEGRKLNNRTKSIIWKGKTIYVVYMSDETELAESKNEVHMLTSLFPAGAGIIHLYNDNRLELFDAFYHDLKLQQDKTVRYIGPKSIDRILGGEAPALLAEVQAAIAEKRDVNAKIRIAGEGRWVRLYARQFWQDDEKRWFYCSFMDADRQMRETRDAGIEPCSGS